MKRASSSTVLAFLMLLIFDNFASAGSKQPVAVVSTLSGDVTVARAGGSIPLKFKDETFPDDIIRTADQSVVRLLLLREKALMTVQQRSVLTLGEEQGTLTVTLKTGQIGLSVADRRLRAGTPLQIETPNVQAALGHGNVVLNTDTISSRVQTTVYVVDGSVEISLRSTGTQRSVKIEGPRKLTVVGKALGTARTLSAAESTQLLAELRATSPQHLNAPREIEGVIVRHGRAEAAKQAQLVAKQVKQGCGSSQAPESSCDRSRPDTRTGFDTRKGAGPESGNTNPGRIGEDPGTTPIPQGGSTLKVDPAFSLVGKQIGQGGGGGRRDEGSMQRLLRPGAAQLVIQPPPVSLQKVAPKPTP